MIPPNEIFKKKILIYGLGKSGQASLSYLKHKNLCYVFDDNKKKINKKIKKFYISEINLIKKQFDYIILSPGIDKKNCLLSSYLKKYKKKIITELDVFYKFNPEILTITVTGTNGKSTTCKLLANILKDHDIDVRLTGNFGKPLLQEKNIKKNTVFVVEASSYQLEYSRYFKSKFSMIINISRDHLERHKTMKNYIQSKLKSVIKQKKGDISIIEDNNLIKKEIKKKNIKSKIIFLKKTKYLKIKFIIKNNYLNNPVNLQNISFLLELSKYLKLKKNIILNTINNFKPLKFRQEITHRSKNLIVINDSKSTTLSSSVPFLKQNEKIYWILGGLIKKGDNLNLKKKYLKSLNLFIFGKDRFKFLKLFKKKSKIELAENLEEILIMISKKIKKEKNKVTILFSPAAASFDQFKNFEDRGEKFNSLTKKYLLNR